MSQLLTDLLDLLGYEAPRVTGEPAIVTSSQSPPVTARERTSNLQGGHGDRCDQCDRETAHAHESGVQRGRFVVGRTYRLSRVERFYRLPDAAREETARAGFTRAGIVVVEGVALLVDDVARAFLDERALVIGFANLPEVRAGVPGRKKRRG